MELNLEEAAALVLQLPVEDRVRLAQRLADSVDQEMEPGVHPAWIVEARRRANELIADPSKGIPIEEALAEVRRYLKG